MKYKYTFQLRPWGIGGYSVLVVQSEPHDWEVENLTVYIHPFEGMNLEIWPDGFWISSPQGRYNKVHRPQIIEQVKKFLIKEML